MLYSPSVASVVGPRDFILAFSERNPQWTTNKQQDATEFLDWVLNETGESKPLFLFGAKLTHTCRPSRCPLSTCQREEDTSFASSIRSINQDSQYTCRNGEPSLCEKDLVRNLQNQIMEASRVGDVLLEVYHFLKPLYHKHHLDVAQAFQQLKDSFEIL